MNLSKAITKLRPCPFCGSNFANITHEGSEGGENGVGFHAVYCKDCGAEGPQSYSPSMAKYLWNRRPKK